MKILILSRKYPPYIGGSQTQLKFLAEELAKSHDVVVAIISSGEEYLSILDKALRWAGKLLGRSPEIIECFASDNTLISAQSPRVQRLIFSLVEKIRVLIWGERSHSLLLQNKITRLLKGVDIVHCFKPDPLALAAYAAAKHCDLPFAITPYIHDRNVAFPELLALMRAANLVFFLTESDRRVLSSLEIPADRLAHMGVAPLIMSNGNGAVFRKEHDLGDHPIVLFLGRMVGYKGTQLVMDASDAVWSKFPSARFVFAGPAGTGGPNFLGRDSRVVFLGTITEGEKANAMAACDIFCMPSRQEILPAVYLEAWLYCKPVIGGTAEGIDELMLQSGGGFISNENALSLADTIINLLDDENMRRRLGEAGQKFVNKYCVLPVVAGRVAAAYSRAVAEQRNERNETTLLI